MAGSHSSGRSSRGSRSAGPPQGRSGSRSGHRRAARLPLRLRLPPFGDRPGERLIAVGVGLFGVGMVAILAVFLPFIGGTRETGALLALASLLTVVGLAAALAGLYQQAKPRDRL